MSVGAAESEDLVVGGFIYEVDYSMPGKLVLAVGWRSHFVSFADISPGLLNVLITWQQSEIPTDQGRSYCFYDLALKVACHDICCILSITHPSPDLPRRELQKGVNMRKEGSLEV